MVQWIVKDSIYKPIWSFIRLLFNYAIYSSILHEPGFTDQLCGPLAIPAQSELLNYVITIEIFNFSFPFILILISRLANGNEKFRRLSQFRFLKVFLIMLLKMFIVFNKAQRRKYYLHVFLIQLLIWFCTIFYDCIGYPKIAQTWQIIFTDSFQRISIFYTITRTFCPNLAIYWFFTNLLLLIISQLQAHALYYYPASERLDPIFPSALYVKQDIYRFMVLTLIYFGLFSLFQSNDYGYGMTIVFLLTFIPFIKAIKMVQSDEYKKSIILMTVICLMIQGLIFVRINNPSLFKVFLPKGSNMCGIFDEIQL